MNYLETRQLDITHPNLALMCPKCYQLAPLGKITCKVTIECNDVLPNLELNAPALLTYPVCGRQTLSNVSMIMCHCHTCHTQMIAIDAEIIDYIRALNQDGFYTENSCAGQHMFEDPENAYIAFYAQAPEELAKAVDQKLRELYGTSIMTGNCKDKVSVINDESHGFIIYMPREAFPTIVNLITDSRTPGYEKFKASNANFGVESLYDRIHIEED